MNKELTTEFENTYNKLKVMSNKYRFKILELTQNKEIKISELSKTLKLSYTNCADYVTMLHKVNLVEKNKIGKEVFIKSKINLKELFSISKKE